MTNQKTTKHYKKLKDKWLLKRHLLQKLILKKNKDVAKWLNQQSKHIAVSSITGLLMLAHPTNASIISDGILNPKDQKKANLFNNRFEFISALKNNLPQPVEPLTKEQEISVLHILTSYFQMPVSASLAGKFLNRSYGLIGKEQHLMRYPGDTIDTHFKTEKEKEEFYVAGMAPGRSAWGYFADSKKELTEEMIEKEKYYIAVQTFLSPGWDADPISLYNFFKHKKMLVVNPENGRAVVVVIGDAGPAPFTGKHLGGSPEVMSFLEREDGSKKGPVLYFFINDPENKIPLGPIENQ